VRQQDVRHWALLPLDVLPRARFPVLPPAATAGPVLGQQVQCRDGQPWLKLETLVQLPQVSQRRARRWSRASPDEWRSRPPQRQDVPVPAQSRGQPRVHAQPRPVLQ
jgi:hypothetical protein